MNWHTGDAGSQNQNGNVLPEDRIAAAQRLAEKAGQGATCDLWSKFSHIFAFGLRELSFGALVCTEVCVTHPFDFFCDVAGTFPVGSVPQDIPARAGRHRPPLGSSPSSEGFMGRGVRYPAFEVEANRGSSGPEVRAPCRAVGLASCRSSVLLRLTSL